MKDSTLLLRSLRIDSISFFTHRDHVQIAASYASDDKLVRTSLELSYPILNNIMMSRMVKADALKIMSAIGERLQTANQRWESFTMSEILGHPVLILGIGLIGKKKSPDLLHVDAFFNYKSDKKFRA
jgi:hypothetical protein